MARVWLLDGKTIAKKVRNASLSSEELLKHHVECPRCRCHIDNRDMMTEWPGLPAGVKFDPSDVQLLDHLAAKCGSAKPHPLVDEFIPTLQEDKGICYTHPENFPGARKDGSTIHFFHKTANAYAIGHKKRRKVQINDNDVIRWHKTGKTKAIFDIKGAHKGYKKFMVLHKNRKKGNKPKESKWVMHQYHLGANSDEDDDQYVVSKVFYQNREEADRSKLQPADNFTKNEVKEEITSLEENVGITQWLCSDLPLLENADCKVEIYDSERCDLAELENLEFDTPPEIGDLTFGSQDNLQEWINRL